MPPHQPTEPEPVPPGSFRALYAAALGPLRRYLARRLGNATEAQDVAQDAFVRVHAVMSRRPLESPQAYLYTTARRLAIDELRRRRLDPLRQPDEGVVVEAVFSDAPGIEQQVMARQELEQTLAVIDTLPPGCRTVFLLSRIDQLTHREIAARLGLSVSTVEKQHARAIRLLRAARPLAFPKTSAQSVPFTGTEGAQPPASP
jgi:RNA polymerase sigma factor (sigma-70 family)